MRSVGRMKIDQIAFYANDEEDIASIKKSFGLDNAVWIKDTVMAKSIIYPPRRSSIETVNKAELQFNYDLGIELEIIRYIEGMSWHNYNPLFGANRRFVSHIGIHLLGDANMPTTRDGMSLVQETFTISHDAEYLTTGAGAGRKYHYRIYEMSPGTYIKYIKRINP